MSRRKRRTPRTTLRPPVSIIAFQPNGLINGLLLGAELSEDHIENETNTFSVTPVQIRFGEQVLHQFGGGQVALHRALQERVARPRRITESAVRLERRAIRRPGCDRGQFAPERSDPLGEHVWAAGKFHPELLAHADPMQPARDAEGRAGQRQVVRSGDLGGVGNVWARHGWSPSDGSGRQMSGTVAVLGSQGRGRRSRCHRPRRTNAGGYVVVRR